jgi:hypothetical protein
MNIGVSVNAVLLKPAITDLRKSHLKEKIRPFYPVRNNKNNSRKGAKTQRRKGKIIMFAFFFASLREIYFYLFGRLWLNSLVKIKILEVSFKAA